MPGLMEVILGNATTTDAQEAEADQRQKYPLLFHPEERVEMAFQVKGFGRDKSFLTTHRLLLKDGKGIGNKRKNYVSIPHETIQCFAIETAGAILDDDIELKVWTSGRSFTKLNFAKKEVDLWMIQQYMNAKMDWSQEISTSNRHATPDNHPIPASQWPTANKKVSVFDWLGGNAYTMDPQQAEDQLKTTTPVLLADETVHMAFRERRDKIFFTSHRLLVINVQGLTGKKMEFKSVPWRFIRGFSIQSAGAFLDVDSELAIYTNIRAMGVLRQDFRQAQVDLLAIQRYLSNRILGTDDDGSVQEGVDRKQGHIDPKGNWFLRDNQRPLDSVEMDRYYHEMVPILQTNETVEFAFRGRRDVTLFTTKRIIDIDPKGITGKRIEYTSFPWTSILAFGAKTVGKYLDTDAEVMFWTDMMYFPGGAGDDPDTPGMSYFEIDFNPKLVDVIKMKRYIAKRLLAHDNNVKLDPNTFALAPTNDGKENWVDWLGDNQRAIDPQALEQKMRENQPDLLLEAERLIMTFQCGRDILLFTSMRMMDYDVRGLSGKKIKYTSIPYSSIRAFKVESAGSFDRDAEAAIYTRNLWDLQKHSMDFRKGKADVIAIQRFLAAVVLGTPDDATRYLAEIQPYKQKKDPATMKNFVSWMLDNSSEEDAGRTNEVLHNDPPILLTGENVNRAYRQGRDLYVWTTHRALVIDVQGLRGKKVEYKSIPIQWCRTFEIETAGHMDRDAEIYVKADIGRGMTLDQSILVKNHDIYTTHEYWTNQLIFSKELAPHVEEEPEILIW